jgi:hypothetical protein
MPTPIRREARRQPRFHLEVLVQLHWAKPEGGLEMYSGRCMEVSASGMRIRMEKPIPLQTVVNLQSPELRLAGSAVVRHFRKRGEVFEVGVEFLGGMEWRPPHGTP